MTMKSGNSCLVISLDTELGWGFHETDGGHHLSSDGTKERKKIQRLLSLFERHNCKATWAIVFHLLLEDCDGRHESRAAGTEWFAEDPGSSVQKDGLRYAPDIVQAIVDSNVEHEIATHTFSHYLHQDETILQDELQKSKQLADEEGIEIQSIVYPQNNIHSTGVAAEEGIFVYRGLSTERKLASYPFGRYIRFLVQTLELRVPIVYPNCENKIWEFPTSYYLPYGPSKRVSRIKKGLDYVASNGGGIHLWAHPHNFENQLFEDLNEILEYSNELGIPSMSMDEAVQNLGC